MTDHEPTEREWLEGLRYEDRHPIPDDLARTLVSAADGPGRFVDQGETLGVWAVMGWWSYPLAVFPDELAARRWADEHGDGEIYWWPWGPWDNATKDRPKDGA